MNNAVAVAQPNELGQFLDFLFDGLEGYMYVATMQYPDKDSWDQAFFEWPAQRDVAVRAINTYSPSLEIYLSPCLFKAKTDAKKENIKYTQVLWMDIDGNAPTEYAIPPSLVIQSGLPQHEHVYWKLDSPLSNIEEIEEYNRRLCFRFDGDNSGWDATQVLRPPYTTNHKRDGLSVAIKAADPSIYFNLLVFDDLAPAPENTVDYGLWEKLDLPSLNEVIYRNKLGPDFQHVFEKNKSDVTDRSRDLTHMAYICAEANLTDKEIYVVISNLADRWGKFSHHTKKSRARQLMAIIEHTRIKIPNQNDDLDQVFEYSPKTLLEAEIQVDWAIPGMLMHNGILLLAGPSGIGKSQLSLQFMAHLAVGKPFLTYELTEPKKVGFLSLEMGDAELRWMLEAMYPIWEQIFTAEELITLNQNLTLIPFGEALPLNSSRGQEVFVGYMEKYHWDGVFIDSIGNAIVGNISSSEVVQGFTNFNDKIRKRYGCFLWYVHHFRKPAQGNQSTGEQADLFGDQYLTARATSVYTITKSKGFLKMKNPKNRHAKEEADYHINRTEGLMFEYIGPVLPDEQQFLNNMVKSIEKKKGEEDFKMPNPMKPEDD